jgi:hypothetical protein
MFALLLSSGGLVLAAGTQFDFTNADLGATLGPGALEYHNGTTTSDDVAVGTASSFGLPVLSGGDADVMEFAAFAQDQGLLLETAAGPNGGGDYINEYTLIWDILVPEISGYMSFYNTSSDNGNDGEFFRNAAAGIGISGQYDGVVNANQWHRIAMVWDVDSMYKYIDGTQVGTQIGLDGVDGRWSLYPTGGWQKTFLLTDNSDETNAGYLSSFYFVDEALGEAAIEMLGGPDADGIVPEPSTFGLLILGAAFLLLAGVRRLRRT